MPKQRLKNLFLQKQQKGSAAKSFLIKRHRTILMKGKQVKRQYMKGLPRFVPYDNDQASSHKQCQKHQVVNFSQYIVLGDPAL